MTENYIFTIQFIEVDRFFTEVLNSEEMDVHFKATSYENARTQALEFGQSVLRARCGGWLMRVTNGIPMEI